MRLTELAQEALDRIKSVRWDRIIEKHEGPEDWESVLEYSQPEFILVDDRPVLLPIDRSHHANITVLRTIWSKDGNSVTLFLKDTTYDDHWSAAGFMAVCDRVADDGFFLAVLYHEWFIIERSPIFEA
jgi:hypothetical protein